MKPKISVIIPVYNAGAAVVKLVNSLLKDEYKNLEVIAVDDGSSDESLALLKKVKHERLKVFHKENGGAASARNFGLRKATGEYISFIDADDEVSPKFLSSLAEGLLAPENALSVTGFRYNRLKLGTTRDTYTHMVEPQQDEESFKCYILRLLAADGRMYSSVNKMYRAEIIRKHKVSFDESLDFAEDTKFVLDYLAAAEKEMDRHPKIAFILKPYYVYNYGTETSTVAETSLAWGNWLRSYRDLKAWLGPHPDLLERRWLTRVYRRWQVAHALAVARADKSFQEKSKYLNPLLVGPATVVARLRK